MMSSHGWSRVFSFTLLGGLMVGAGCGGGGETPTPTATPTAADLATFTRVQEEVLLLSCAFSSCHGSGTGGLQLDASSSYTNLVDVPSVQVPAVKRVVPGDPDGSYLMWKLEGTAGIVEDPMPPPSGNLDAERIALVRSWIAAGALDD